MTRTRVGRCRMTVQTRVWAPLPPRMGTMVIEVPLELEELQLQISGRPEERPVQAFASNGANQTFDEWMRERHVRHRLDFVHVEDAQIRLPLVELVQPIVVGAEVRRWRLAPRGSVKHATESDAVHGAAVHANAHDTTC